MHRIRPRPSKFRQRLTALVGFGIAVAGGIVLLLHVIEAAFTQHVWFLIGQGMVIGGGLMGLMQVWGRPRRSRR